MTEPFCRHHASGCANQTKVRRIPLLHSRATSKASTPPHRMRGNNCAIRGCGGPSGSVTPPESSNWYPMLASSRMAILPPRRRAAITLASSRAAILPPPQEGSKPAPFGLLLGALFTRRTLPRRDPPRRTLPRRIFAPGSQDQRCRIAHRKVASQQPLQWNANLAVLCPQ